MTIIETGNLIPTYINAFAGYGNLVDDGRYMPTLLAFLGHGNKMQSVDGAFQIDSVDIMKESNVVVV